MMSQHGNPNVSNLNPQCVLNNQMAPNCYETLWTWTIFYFLFLLFSDFIGILFSFSFSDDEEARDIAVT